MPITDRYVVPEHVVNFLCDYERSFLGLRLVHGLIYAMDHVVKGKMSLVPARFYRGHSVRTSTLAAAVGPEKAKDNRWIHAACQELVGQNILQSVEVNGRPCGSNSARTFWRHSRSQQKPSRSCARIRSGSVGTCTT